MKDILIYATGVLFYASGLLVWPVCALVWRKKRRTTALRWVFIGEIVSVVALGLFARFSGVELEHGYYWLIYWILLNAFFTVLACGAAIYDYFGSE